MQRKSKSITKKDNVFCFSTPNDSMQSRNLSYYGWEFSVEHFFYNYIQGYKQAAKATYMLFLQSASNKEIDVQDTICYPLVFLFRHITELYLKYIYIHLYHPKHDELKAFINKGHDLKSLWNGLKEKMIMLSTRVGFNLDADAIEHYISEFVVNDESSFAYRYPIKKSIKKVHSRGRYLDVTQLYDCMEAFFRYLDSVLANIEDQWVDDEYNEDFNKLFDETLRDSQDVIYRITLYLNHRERDLKGDNNNDKAWVSLSEINSDDEREREEEYRILSELTENQKTLFILLYLAGSVLPQQNLAETREERRRDVYKLLYNENNSDWAFYSQPSDYKNNICFQYVFGSTKSAEYIQRILDELK